ncbi:hypothetical protein F0562_003731 [Nyssa sinensis]|uniref:Uncharacterized protein n=1 Tax=Nyssa sinensis TaxID=561372 RepID=A0A5J5BWK1_9ASTE|nr:hypothetical protein F0562_003731 [Nyssa sinensis]
MLDPANRAVLQGNANNELEICLESGDPAVEGFEGSHLVFVAAGSDPFDVITNTVKTVERHLQTFCQSQGAAVHNFVIQLALLMIFQEEIIPLEAF